MDATTPYIVGPMFNQFETLHNNSQQHTTKCHRVCKEMQHVTSKNVGSCWPTLCWIRLHGALRLGFFKFCLLIFVKTLLMQIIKKMGQIGNTCLCKTASSPCVNGFSKGCPNWNSRRSFTGGVSPLESASKYLQHCKALDATWKKKKKQENNL